MHALLENTIIAEATPSGKGALKLLRVSGEGVPDFIKVSCKKSGKILENPRVQIYTALINKVEVIDYVLVSFFPGPQSYTGEDMLELSIHGSPVILREVLRMAYSSGIKPAQPGEFTRRAFMNGKLDLAQAEAVSDLIAAESRSQAKIAKEQLEGKLSNAVDFLGEPLRDLLSEIEAYIDFPDEDISPATINEWHKVSKNVLGNIDKYLDTYLTGRILREGASISLAGIPNAGKSSLMNLLLGEERAIVTDVAGTTRDSIEEKIELDGILFRLHDTAGIVDESVFNEKKIELPEQLGIKRSWKLIENSDLVLFLFDKGSTQEQQKDLYKRIKQANNNIIILATKSDLYKDLENEAKNIFAENEVLTVSSQSGSGIEKLKNKIISIVSNHNSSEDILISTERHFLILKEARKNLNQAIEAISQNLPSEYIAFEIRQTLNSLTEIVGVTTTEEILGRIFTKFCIGK